jgi:putative glycosyltransferase (TIGR04372 family)
MFRRLQQAIALRAICQLYIFLPFKAIVLVSAILRRRFSQDTFNAAFRFFCEREIEPNLDWLLSGRLPKKFRQEILYFLNISGWQKVVISQFSRIDWSDRRAFFVNALASLIERFASGYAMDIVVRLHQVTWVEPPTAAHKALAVLMRRMLEHRLFEFEERILRGRREAGYLPFDIETTVYVPHFYRNKQVIKSIGTDVGLNGIDVALAKLDAEGQHWEQFPDLDTERDIISDIHLFYAYRDLILFSYHNGEGHLVPLLCRKSAEVQARLKPALPDPSPELRKLLISLGITSLADVKLMWPDWAALIGHNGHLNVHLMMRELGWWRGSPILLAWKERIANPTFLSLFEEICPTLILGENVSAAVWHELASLIPFIGVSHQTFQFQDGSSMYWNDAGGKAIEKWEAEGRGYPLRDVYDRRTAENSMQVRMFNELRFKWGMSPGDWHICLHMRDGETRGETDGKGETIRNTSIANYMEAIQYIVDQGGWVIRMGGPKVSALPTMDHVIDYARMPERSPEMDIHLMRTARMFIGTTSGFAYVASSFGIPTAMVNALSSVGLIWSKDTRFALKPVRTAEGRLLTQNEVTSERWRWAFPTHESLNRAGLVVEESSPDEILETVKEVFALTKSPSSAAASQRIAEWRTSVSIPGFYGAAVPSTYFLDKYGSAFVPRKEDALVSQ